MGIYSLLPAARKDPCFSWRGRTDLKIAATNAIPKEEQYSTRKEVKFRRVVLQMMAEMVES